MQGIHLLPPISRQVLQEVSLSSSLWPEQASMRLCRLLLVLGHLFFPMAAGMVRS